MSPTFGNNFVPLKVLRVKTSQALNDIEGTYLVGEISDTDTINGGGRGSHFTSTTGTTTSKNQASQNGLRNLVLFGVIWLVAEDPGLNLAFTQHSLQVHPSGLLVATVISLLCPALW
jgi:hypothetical protein